MGLFDIAEQFVGQIAEPVEGFLGDIGQQIGIPFQSNNIIQKIISNGGILPPGTIPILPILPIPTISVPNPMDFIKELCEAVAKIFSDIFRPLLDRLDVVISGGIQKFQSAAVFVIDKFEDVANNIISTASTAIEKIVANTISKIQELLDKALEKIRTLLGVVNDFVEARINQISSIIASSLDTVAKIADKFTPGKIMQDLVSPALEKLSKLEQQLFRDINEVLDKIIDKIDQKAEEFKKHERLLTVAFGSPLAKDVLKELNMKVQDIVFSDMNYYNFLKTYSLRNIERDGTITIFERLQAYAEIQENAAIMKFLKVVSSQADDFFAREWMSYGLLYQETKKFI
jgi:DNA-binding transcriptional regulator GbsR (MarR family)